MEVVIQEDTNRTATQVVINCKEIDNKVRRIESFVKRLSFMIHVVSEGETCQISADDILYIESIDRRTFFYTLEKVYETRTPLYQLENQLKSTGIVRISKNCLLNVDSLKSICPFTNHRFEATLVNGEKVMISRNYIDDLKRKLER